MTLMSTSVSINIVIVMDDNTLRDCLCGFSAMKQIKISS